MFFSALLYIVRQYVNKNCQAYLDRICKCYHKYNRKSLSFPFIHAWRKDSFISKIVFKMHENFTFYRSKLLNQTQYSDSFSDIYFQPLIWGKCQVSALSPVKYFCFTYRKYILICVWHIKPVRDRLHSNPSWLNILAVLSFWTRPFYVGLVNFLTSNQWSILFPA